MLFFAIVLGVVGYDLAYAGLKRGDLWRRPWQPVADALTASAASAGVPTTDTTPPPPVPAAPAAAATAGAAAAAPAPYPTKMGRPF